MKKKTLLKPKFHASSFLFSVMAMDTQMCLHEYETTITIQHNDVQVTHYERALDVQMFYTKLPLSECWPCVN